MTQEKKIALLEDMLELDGGTLKPETDLISIDEYDSMAKLSLIVLMDDEFSKKLTGEQIRDSLVVVGKIDLVIRLNILIDRKKNIILHVHLRYVGMHPEDIRHT